MKQRIEIQNFVREQAVVFIALGVLILLMILYPGQIRNYPRYVDWRTILSLTGLMLTTVGMKESRVYRRLSTRIIKKISTERQLALFFVSFSALLSTFLTNDITLFIIVPLTICTLQDMKNDLAKLIIFEAMAVNVGSALTPIGNPQNLFLWHSWHIPFFTFMYKMTPLFILTMALLIIMTIIIFPTRQIHYNESSFSPRPPDYKLFYYSVALLFIFLVAISYDWIVEGLALIIIFYLWTRQQVLARTDWMLLLFFMLIFIDLRVISRVPEISALVNNIDLSSGKNTFLFSSIISQIISNVPASIFVHHFSHDLRAIAYGVNIGGNGLIIGSLANFIALRLSSDRKIIWKFHLFSIPFFIVSCALVYWLLMS